MTRTLAIERACQVIDSGALAATLARRVAFASESEDADRAAAALGAYLADEIAPSVAALG
jgi:hypothetical protein